MNVEGPRDISGLIAAWGRGEEQALNSLMPLVYSELRRIARRHLGCRPPGQTLESAALANEAYLKLVRAGGVHCESRVHFLALCSQIIRRILVDHARSRGYAKRGGGAVQIPLDEELVAAETHQVDVLALDEALTSLFQFDPRKARVVELRYFGGLSVEETAEVLGISPETAKRDWKTASLHFGERLSHGIVPPPFFFTNYTSRGTPQVSIGGWSTSQRSFSTDAE
jgi:RNA polymerase sigma-70 factor (ECF subfamily)